MSAVASHSVGKTLAWSSPSNSGDGLCSARVSASQAEGFSAIPGNGPKPVRRTRGFAILLDLQGGRARGKRIWGLLVGVLDAGEAAKLMGRGGRRHLARAYLVLQFLEVAGRAPPALEGGKQALLENLPHPGRGLVAAAFIERARGCERGIAFLDLCPQLVQPRVVPRREGEDHGLPV